MKSLAEPGSRILRGGVTLGVVCGPWSTLDRERGSSLGFGLSFQDEVTLLGQVVDNLIANEAVAQLTVTVSLIQSASLLQW